MDTGQREKLHKKSTPMTKKNKKAVAVLLSKLASEIRPRGESQIHDLKVK